MTYPEYLESAVVVEGYFFAPEGSDRPTVLDVLGPEYAVRNRDIFVDNSVLDGVSVDERDAILREEEVVRRQGKQAHGRVA